MEYNNTNMLELREKVNSGEYNLPEGSWIGNPLLSDKDIKIRVEEKRRLRMEQYALTQKFMLDLFKALDIENHPKREALWKLAWEEGHANGYLDVIHYAEEFMELLS